MEDLIVALFSLILISLNIVFIVLFLKEKLNLMVSGVIMMVLAPIIGFASGAAFLHFSAGGTGEGAGFAGAFLGFITLANGILILVIGIIRWFLHFVKKEN
ncbi:hypothetical protein [Alkalihalobacterium bogoriense]|uniref:hypothetical protein n=1 Tax=Alkalihalobacterium bogoriense TaxID=246272 RepID=UPI00047A4E4A|nr:hypothetical protein [Alkalihalobacterium bogoriense]